MTEVFPNRICWMRQTKEDSYCQNDYYDSIRVRVVHLDTGRKSVQRWDFCEEHFYHALETGLVGLTRWYENSTKECKVIEIVEIGIVEF